MGPQLSTVDIEKNDEITLTIHGKQHHVLVGATQRITPTTSLVTYLRDFCEMRDTKPMCREGGCGACIVSVTFIHPHTKRKVTRAVNSCLVPILACHNWEVVTIHGLGNRDDGYHQIQEALAHFNGSQCGFCSGGMVMNMYAQTASHDVLTMHDVEDAFGGNLCRCTGYRPIMDAFKSLAEDADPALREKLADIEDLKICKKTNKICEGECENVELPPFYLDLADDMQWYKVNTIQEILRFFKHIGSATYRFVAGNTGQGVYKITVLPKYWVDIRCVKELISYKVSDKLVLGANMTLSDVMELFQKLGAEERRNFWYLLLMWYHLDLVANVPVRNFGTLAGNLSLKHDHHEFPSDVFLIFVTVGAKITIIRESGHEVTMSLIEFINFDMYKCVMKEITLPAIKKETHLFQTYKIMPRAQNAHAHVNAGFLIEHDGNYKVKSATIVYGGINPNFIHATNTEKYLKDKHFFDDNVLQGALAKLTEELKPDHVLPDPSPEFRKNLARNLFYKFFLSAAPKDKLNPKYQSGGSQLDHKLLSGVQFYQTNEKMYPVTKPVNKIEALIQSSGEAQYIDDMPALPGELFGAFVLAETTPLSKIKHVDTSEAMKMLGVSAYVDHKDIPGKNVFTTSKLNPSEEQIFCEDVVQYNGQPLGVIVADTYERAIAAALKVKVTYEKTSHKPDYTIQDVLKDKQKNKDRIIVAGNLKPTRKGDKTKHVVKGSLSLSGQYHFHMETQRCVCVPSEDGGYDIYASTQWMDQVQMAAANALKLTMDKITVFVRRLGGAYGAKILRSSLISTACVVACHKVHRPLRLILPLDINMKTVGKRFPTYAEYEVGVDDDGVIQYLDSEIYQACGISGLNEEMVRDIPHYMTSGYESDTWKLTCSVVTTDMAGNGYCRAPGSSEAIAIIENIMDHISVVTNKSLVEVRRKNLQEKATDMKEVMNDLLKWADYDTRLQEVKKFNEENRWMKRGLNLVIMDYHMMLFYPYSVLIAVYAGDGSVAISHGGIECGQGINTKVVQVCAYELGIPMDTITIKPSNTVNAPNNLMTGGSVTSEGVCYATIQACKELLKRLQPVREQMNNPPWKELVWAAKGADVELCATGIFTSTGMNEYPIPGAVSCEVQVDLLTGEHVVTRVDLLEDVGQSMSPSIDAGQIEGAFIMGLGNYTCEDLVYEYKDGSIQTYNTWTYKIPGVKDVPQNFRIQFRQNSTNPRGILNSKATGEPALALSIGVPYAIRQALLAAKKGGQNFFNPDGPCSVEFTLQHSSSDYKDYKL